MRISTGQMFQQSTTSILQKQTATNQILDQLSSGKRVNSAGDDPVASIAIDNLKQKTTVVDQFIKNIGYATSHVQRAESRLGDADNLASSMRDALLRGANGSMTSAERQAIADEMTRSLDQFIALANTKDESGNYIFAGQKTATEPFAFDVNKQIIYSGDSGKSKSNVASDVQVNINVPGDAAFMNGANAMGDYRVNYLASQQGDFSVSSAKITPPTPHIADIYTFNFVDDGAGGINLEVFDSALPANNVTTVVGFDPTVPVSFNGIAVKLDGEPKIGDSFTINEDPQVSIFESFSKAIDLLKNGTQIQTPAGQSELAQLLNNIDSGVKQMSQERSLSGNSLKVLEQHSDNHTDEKLINTSALSTLEDLDLSAAITEFEKQKLSLNAVSSVFSKVSSISLFNYI
jgi:flagellar hook-associated protein 3 FlgL